LIVDFYRGLLYRKNILSMVVQPWTKVNVF
jgi:hypothetical protein